MRNRASASSWDWRQYPGSSVTKKSASPVNVSVPEQTRIVLLAGFMMIVEKKTELQPTSNREFEYIIWYHVDIRVSIPNDTSLIGIERLMSLWHSCLTRHLGTT